MSEINMTPLIDVMLVLLVIFMIAAPLMTSNLQLDLPKTSGNAPATPPAALQVAVTADGSLYLSEQPVDADTLKQRAEQAAKTSPSTEVQLRADQAVPYGRVAELIALMQDAGLSRIGFITTHGGNSP